MEVEQIITEEMIEEEEHILEENNEEIKEMQNKYHNKNEIQQELSEQRHKRLMHLLTKSQFYSQFLLKKMDQINTPKSKGRPKKRLKTEDGKENLDSNNATKSNGLRSNSQTTRQGGKADSKSFSSKEISSANDEAVSINQECGHLPPQTSQMKFFENGKLRPYQIEGFKWLKSLYENGISGILADEMGLGKTVQVIAMICHIIEMGIQGPFLVVAPLSTLPNWISEFQRFAPKLPILLYHGYHQKRKEMRLSFQRLQEVEGDIKSLPIVITSYEVAIRDCKFMRNCLWRYLVVDEGHRLKNHNCMLAKSLNSLSTSNRVILTGTPLQNNLAELWSLLHFLLPEIFDNLDVFESWFEIDDMLDEGADERIVEQERNNQIVSTLHKILSPFLLRRLKVDLDLGIPMKRELIVYVPMTRFQYAMYMATLTKDMTYFQELCEMPLTQYVDETAVELPKRRRSKGKNISLLLSKNEADFETFLEEATKTTPNRATPKTKNEKYRVYNNMRNISMQCRRVVNHPYLVRYPLDVDGNYKIDEDILKQSGKLQVVDQLLQELFRRGHRVLLFSQMIKVLDIIEDYLTLRPNFKYKRLDGQVTIDERAKDIKSFNEDQREFLYLLSTRAGGLGVNLASADTVIIYDSDWNPQQDLQAQDRCHRIGQTRPVTVLRLVAAASVDQKMVERAAAKRKLEKMIMKKGQFQNSTSNNENDEPLNPDELLKLLKSSDYDRIHRASAGTGIFSKKEIDQMLDRSAQGTSRQNTDVEGLKGVYKIIE